jgi:hypothetical protein
MSMAFVVVLEKDRMRSSVEDAIRAVYRDRYGARLACFPEVLVAEITPWGTIECAAGLRFGCHRLFLEYYLDIPVELALERRFGRRIDRRRAVEVCHLVASAPKSSLPFVHRIVEYVESEDAEWAVFTATKPLRALLRKERLKMVELAPAQRVRVPNPADWGTYFEHDPRVMAVNRSALFENVHLRAEPARISVPALA